MENMENRMIVVPNDEHPLAITNESDPQSKKVAHEGVRLHYCLQRCAMHLIELAQKMQKARLESKNWRIAADVISMIGNVVSIIGIFFPPVVVVGLGASIPATLYRMKKDADHRCMERKAKHEESGIEAIAAAFFENFGRALWEKDPSVYCDFVAVGLLDDLKLTFETIRLELCGVADKELLAKSTLALTGAQKGAQMGAQIAKFVKYTNTVDDTVSAVYSSAQVARAVDLTGDIKNVFTVAASASQWTKALGVVANGVGLVADGVSLCVDICDDGTSHISKIMISMAEKLEQFITKFDYICPEISTDADAIVARFLSSDLYNFRLVDESFTSFQNLRPKYGDVIECKGTDGKDSTFAFYLDHESFLEFVPEEQSKAGNFFNATARLYGNYGPIDWVASKASMRCTIRGRIEISFFGSTKYSKFRIHNKIDDLIFPSSIQRMKDRVEHLRVLEAMDYNVLGQNPEHVVNFIRSGFGYSFQTGQFCRNLFDLEHDPLPDVLENFTIEENLSYFVEEAE